MSFISWRTPRGILNFPPNFPRKFKEWPLAIVWSGPIIGTGYARKLICIVRNKLRGNYAHFACAKLLRFCIKAKISLNKHQRKGCLKKGSSKCAPKLPPIQTTRVSVALFNYERLCHTHVRYGTALAVRLRNI